MKFSKSSIEMRYNEEDDKGISRASVAASPFSFAAAMPQGKEVEHV